MTPEFLRANLCFVHGTMQASEGLLEAAIRKSAGDLRAYFRHHLLEETGHLDMLEADLRSLGVTQVPKFPAAAQLAGAQYYYIEHEHPALLLGYMAALEGNPLPLAVVDEMEAKFGPLTCVRYHALHDIEHGAALRAQIDALKPAIRRRVLENEAWTLQDIKARITPMIVAASNHFLRH